MSTFYLSACWQISLPTSPKIVLISVADQANDDGECWPSVRTIGLRCGLRPRQTRYWLSWLEKHKYLKRQVRIARSTLYLVTVPLPPRQQPAYPNHPPAAIRPTPRQRTAAPPGSSLPPEPSVESIKNQELLENSRLKIKTLIDNLKRKKT